MIEENIILAICSDGYIRTWNLDQPLGAIDQPDQSIKMSKKSLTSIVIFKQQIIVGDLEGVIYMASISDEFVVSAKKKIHKGLSLWGFLGIKNFVCFSRNFLYFSLKNEMQLKWGHLMGSFECINFPQFKINCRCRNIYYWRRRH